MLELIYAPVFLREFKKLESSLQDEILEKIELFKNSSNHKQLKVHKLKGSLKGRYSFSVNYRYRIIFSYASKGKANILTVGSHKIYD